MSINVVSGFSSSQSSQNLQATSEKIQAVIANLVSGSTAQTGDNVANVSVATQLQSSLSGLRQLSENLSQAGSLTQVAEAGIGQVQNTLQQLQSLARQASTPDLSDTDRNALNQQFQQLAASIDQTVNAVTFNGQPLLNGKVSGNQAISFDSVLSGDNSDNGGGELSIPSLSTSSLFGGQAPSLSSADSAQQALATLGNALSQVTNVLGGIGAFQQSVDFASATVDSAGFNQQAAMSNLSDTDFADASSQLSLANVQQNSAIALAAQGNLLNPALLQLIG